MARITLSNAGDWELKFDDQDVRGFEAVDAEGNHVSQVEAMIVDTDERRVDAVLLENGTEYPARDLSIGDGVVYLTTIVPDDVRESVTVYDDYGHVVERERVTAGDYNAYADDFQSHFGETYDGDFSIYEPAYRYGHDAAYEDANRHRSYSEAEGDLETGYARAYPDSDYQSVRDAIRYGYTRAQRGS